MKVDIAQAKTARESAEASLKQTLAAKDEQLQKLKADLTAAEGGLKQS